MTNDEALAVRDGAIALRDNLQNEINNALTRQEHIRITQLAMEADRLVETLNLLLAPEE